MEFKSTPEPNSKSDHLFNTLVNVNEHILKGTPYEAILDFLFDSLQLVIPYDRIGVALLEKRADHLRLQMDWVKSREKILHLNLPYSTSEISPSLNSIMETNQPRIINDLVEYFHNHPHSKPTELIIKDGVRSSLTCPIRFNNKPLGVIFFSSFHTGTYDEQHIDLFKQIAAEISVIINHGKLQKTFAQAEHQNRNVNMTLHDLKSPLGVLQGFAELSIERPWFKNLETEAKLVFQTFFRNTQYMIQLVNELSELVVLQNGTDSCHFKNVNTIEFINEIIQIGQQMAGQKDIYFKSLPQNTLPRTAFFDPHKIKRVLLNLISNAVKFSKRKSEITFSATSKMNRLYFSVQDQGLGIPENEFGKLFQEFGKTSVRPTEGEMSTGQGLAISKRIVDGHRGQISVHSVAGQGSTFSFWIPLQEESQNGQIVPL